MNKRFYEKAMEIKDVKDTWMEMAIKCNIKIDRFKGAVANLNKLNISELYSIFKYSNYNTSYNELLNMFDYSIDKNVIVKGEIYKVDFGSNKGSIQSGSRPAVIISNNINNRFSSTVNVAPITSKSKTNIPSHVVIDKCGLQTTSIILTEQVKTINKSELGDFIGACNNDIINKINEAMQVQFNIETKNENSSILMSFIDFVTNNVKMKDTKKLESVLLNQLNNFQTKVGA